MDDYFNRVRQRISVDGALFDWCRTRRYLQAPFAGTPSTWRQSYAIFEIGSVRWKMAKNHPETIVISDDEDSTTNGSPSRKDESAKQDVQKAAVIIIPDEDSTDQVSCSSTRDKPSPWKNSSLKFSEHSMKTLKASVKLNKLDLDSFKKLKTETVKNCEVNDDGRLVLKVSETMTSKLASWSI